MKLSPNLRKQTKEVRTAMITKDEKKAHYFEVKKLESILDMVRDPENKSSDDHDIQVEAAAVQPASD